MAIDRILSRRRFLGGVTVGATALLAACAPAAPPPAATTAPAAPAAPTTVPAAPTAAPAPATAPSPTPAPAAAAQTGTKGPVTLVFSNWNDDTYGRFREEEKTKLFNQTFPNVTINMRLFRQNYRDTLLTQIAGGQGADVFRLDVPDMYPFADQGTIPDVTARMKDKDNWYSSSDCKREIFDGLLYRGKFYGLAIGVDSNGVEFNGSLFDDAKVPRPPQSYADKNWNVGALLEAAKKLTVRQGGTPTQFGINADTDAWQLAPFIWSQGGRSLSDDLTTLMWHEEPAVKAIQFMADLVNVHKVAPAPSGGDAKTFGYPTGKLAMYWSYPSQLVYRYNAKLTWDWQVAPVPQATATPRTTVLYNLWTMNAKSKNPDESWAYASFLAGPIATRVDTELGWGLPTFTSVDDAYYKRILKDFPNKNTKVGLENVQNSKGWYDPHMQPGWSEAERKYISPALDEVMLGTKTAADAVKAFKPDVDKLLQAGAKKLTG